MKDSLSSVDSAKASPKSQRQRTTANAATIRPNSQRTPRVTRTPTKTTGLDADRIGDKDAIKTPGKNKKKVASTAEEVTPPLLQGGAPKKSKQPGEVKQEIEDVQEQKPSAEQSLQNTKRGRRIKEDPGLADPQINEESPKTVKRKRVVKVEEAGVEVGEPSPKKTKWKKATAVEFDKTVENETSPKKAERKDRVKEEGEQVEEGEEEHKKIKRKRKTKEERELEAMPLAARTDGLRMFIGAHVSGAKGRSFFVYIASVELRSLSKYRNI